MKKADWFDPIAARNDDIFGDMEHKENGAKVLMNRAELVNESAA